MTLNLNDVLARHTAAGNVLQSKVDAGEWGPSDDPLSESIADIPALVEEVMRLRDGAPPTDATGVQKLAAEALALAEKAYPGPWLACGKDRAGYRAPREARRGSH